MIPLYKLEKLPRTQKLRKIAKFLGMAENRLLHWKDDSGEKYAEIFSASELVFFADAARLLAGDPLFAKETQKIFTEAANFFGASVAAHGSISHNITGGDKSIFRRILNSMKHILLAETGRDQADWDFTGIDGKLDSGMRHVIEGMHVYMEDIRSPFNIGAMFRTAESFGVEKIILSPFCADPLHTRAQRTAMGCIDVIPWEKRELFHEGTAPCEPVFALETGGIPLAEFPFPNRGILIVGSEELGVSPRALEAADDSLGRVSIPCFGTKASLNVSVAFGIAVQAWRERL
ncbi:MAG: TrmH family RNA methyltransferase [Treponema sp.]|nr:TrmH family RNA methyltransferase [Treponema sp.]MCL2236789.1 TrmH family RNA methyltransferase [Treponema sp.]